MEKVISNPDLVNYILAFLGGEDLVSPSFVCKGWNKLCKTREGFPECPGPEYTANIASKGYIELLKWSRRNGCPWNCRVYWGAAEKGDIELLTWAKKLGCPKSFDNSGAGEFTALLLTVCDGQLESLKWFDENGWEWKWGIDALVEEAIKAEKQEIVNWLKNIL